MLAAAVAIRIDDGGPVLFRQERVGHGGQRFEVVKLRTMRRGRVTRVGRWLRPTGLDEVPQMLNVLRGEMDLVGPRPLTESDVDRLARSDTQLRRRLHVRPGITGLAQVLGGRNARHCSRLERLYARRRTVGSDVALLAASVCINALGRHRIRAALTQLRKMSR